MTTSDPTAGTSYTRLTTDLSLPALAASSSARPATPDSSALSSRDRRPYAIHPREIKSLEHASVRVPYEIVNRKYRQAQKVVDREVYRAVTSSTDIMRYLDDGAWSAVASEAEALITQLSGMKRKLEEVVEDELSSLGSCKRRLEHLRTSESDPEAFHRVRVDRMLTDYLLRRGCYDAARLLAECTSISDLSNVEIFIAAKEIEESLHRRETAQCLAWCHENRSKLKRLRSTLEFRLRQQEFIELVKNGIEQYDILQ